ncbi:MAG: exonuclease SbcCD subunit D [Spirochaetia bacterium]
MKPFTLIHVSDLHIGRILYSFSLLQQQKEVLSQIISHAKEQNADAVLLSGDIYDRAMPSGDAVSLFDSFLTGMVKELGVPVIIISGNHDSPERLGFSAKLLEKSGVYLRTSLSSIEEPVLLRNEDGELQVFTLPFVEPVRVRSEFDQQEVNDHNSAVSFCVSMMQKHMKDNVPAVLLAHCFAAGSSRSESERPLQIIGGAEAVSPEVFSPFTYTALGHLHKPQSVSKDPEVRYSGSIMKYSFSEVSHQKSALLVKIHDKKKTEVTSLPLKPKKDLRTITGKFHDLLQKAQDDENSEDYILAVLEDDGPVYDALYRLRELYPNLMHIERKRLKQARENTVQKKQQVESLSDLFCTFYFQTAGREISPEKKKVLDAAVNEITADGGDT